MALALVVLSAPLTAQSTGELHLRRLLATPIGGLPPVAMPMPASRDRNYWTLRMQAGHHHRANSHDVQALAGGIDIQWQGGSVAGITVGQQFRDCDPGETTCGGHTMLGARARVGLMSGGPTIAGLIGDYSATTTLGFEGGLGYAPKVQGLGNACTVDIGMPVSVSMLQRIRVVTFLSPGVAWDTGCLKHSESRRAASFVLGYGLGVQQLWLRGLDVNVGVQRIFRQGTGLQIGISFIYVKLP